MKLVVMIWSGSVPVVATGTIQPGVLSVDYRTTIHRALAVSADAALAGLADSGVSVAFVDLVFSHSSPSFRFVGLDVDFN